MNVENEDNFELNSELRKEFQKKFENVNIEEYNLYLNDKNNSFFNQLPEADNFSDVSSIGNLENEDVDNELNFKFGNEKNNFKIKGNVCLNNKLDVQNMIERDHSNTLEFSYEEKEEIKEIENLTNLNKLDNLNNININDKNESYIKKKKRNKEDLNKTPLPIFDCIYCSNEKIVFDHMIKVCISDKYKIMTSKLDINKIEKIISNPIVINSSNFDFETQHLINFIITHTEYFKNYISSHKEENKKVSNLLKSVIDNIYYEKEDTKKVKILSPNLRHKWCTFDNTLTLIKTKIKSNWLSNEIKFNSKILIENNNSPNYSNFNLNNINNLNNLKI